MGRPETISCERCGTTVAVKAKGPVPSFCADCRRSGSSPSRSRPKLVACERCGQDVAVGARGPLPRYCRGGCQTRTPLGSNVEAHSASPENGWQPGTASPPETRNPSLPVVLTGPLTAWGPIREQVQARGAPRPFSQPARPPAANPAPKPPERVRPARGTRPSPAASVETAPAPPPLMNVADTEGPTILATVSVVPDGDATRRQRQATLRQLRNRASVALWIIAILVIVLVFLIGSRPAPPPSSLGVPTFL